MITLLEGVPGSGKSTVMRKLLEQPDIHFYHEFHTQRKIITQEHGSYHNGKPWEQPYHTELQTLEDELETFLLAARFQDESPTFENLKQRLFNQRLKTLQHTSHQHPICKEALLGGLVDTNSTGFLDHLRTTLSTTPLQIIYLTIDEDILHQRQQARIAARGGVYNDATNKQRTETFQRQFQYVTQRLGPKLRIIAADETPQQTAQKVQELLQ
ncbi:MAG: hypothetical protein Q7R96_00825 [Nanoarchaeota archaeon]|nr:hypothetical protein [Nanoarchaeota archaeon]